MTAFYHQPCVRICIGFFRVKAAAVGIQGDPADFGSIDSHCLSCAGGHGKRVGSLLADARLGSKRIAAVPVLLRIAGNRIHGFFALLLEGHIPAGDAKGRRHLKHGGRTFGHRCFYSKRRNCTVHPDGAAVALNRIPGGVLRNIVDVVQTIDGIFTADGLAIHLVAAYLCFKQSFCRIFSLFGHQLVFQACDAAGCCAASIFAADGDGRKLLLPAFRQAAEAYRRTGAVYSFNRNLFFYGFSVFFQRKSICPVFHGGIGSHAGAQGFCPAAGRPYLYAPFTAALQHYNAALSPAGIVR